MYIQVELRYVGRGINPARVCNKFMHALASSPAGVEDELRFEVGPVIEVLVSFCLSSDHIVSKTEDKSCGVPVEC